MEKEVYARLSKMLIKRLKAIVYDYDVVNDIMTFMTNDGQTDSIKSYRQKMYRAQKAVIHPDFRDILSSIYAGHVIEPKPVLLDLSHWPSGKFSWYEVLSIPIFDDKGHVERTVGAVWKTDSPYENDADKSEVLFHSDQDPITGLLNAIGIKKAVNNYLGRTGKDLVNAIIEVRFKGINPVDKSRYIKEFKFSEYALNILIEQLKEIFYNTDLLGYYEGNFLIFMKDIKDDFIVNEKIKMIMHLLEEKQAAFCIPGIDYYLGGAVYPADGSSYTELLQAADRKIICKKHNGS